MALEAAAPRDVCTQFCNNLVIWRGSKISEFRAENCRQCQYAHYKIACESRAPGSIMVSCTAMRAGVTTMFKASEAPAVQMMTSAARQVWEPNVLGSKDWVNAKKKSLDPNRLGLRHAEN